MSQTSTSTLLKSLGRHTATFVTTGLVVIVSAAAVWQGSTFLADRAEAVEKPAATQALVVSTSRIELVDGYEVARRFTGQIEALQTANLSFEQGGTLVQVLVSEGDAVSEGQVIARLDDRLLRSEVRRLAASKQALQAQLDLATLTNERQSKLKERGFATAQTADQTRLSISELSARLAEVDAAIVAAEIRLEKAELRAPFAGIVNQRLVDPGNTAGSGQSIVSMVENGNPVFRVGVDPSLAGQLTMGDEIPINFADVSYQAEVVGVLPQVDAATRTRTVRAQLKAGTDLAFGQTGEAVLVQNIAEAGTWLPLTAIEDGVRGLWTIKTIRNAQPAEVGVEAVEIIYADSSQAFVRGTFEDGTRYIDEGAHRVVAGQTVRVAQ
ncbi:MAG: efflux RND transporter periplasmic adaptor subunit [Pseudomonadota bacterium]